MRPEADLVLACDDLQAALDDFTNSLGFRLEMIVPADAPRAAVISGHGVRVRLEAAASTVPRGAPTTLSPMGDGICVTRVCETAWGVGRAGMRYRDLVPGRLGGRFIASHIRIDDGGPVPDHVHHHRVRFQLIYCRAGWVKVVYEDQGPAFVLRAGDCVLQPPHIRHRVLESSDGMEVIEISCPAEHETFIDHDMPLPTAAMRPSRDFDGQTFIRHQADRAVWLPGPDKGFEARDTGVGAAAGGFASVRVLRRVGEFAASDIAPAGELLFVFVLAGSLTLERPGETPLALAAGDAVAAAGAPLRVTDASEDLELLHVAVEKLTT